MKKRNLRIGLARLIAMGLCSAMLLEIVPTPVYAAEDEIETVAEDDDADDADDTDADDTDEEGDAQEQTITVAVSEKTYQTTDLKKAAKTFQIGAEANTELSYAVVGNSKYVSVSETGKVTIKKNTPKGTYKVQVTASATDDYDEATETVTITVKASSQSITLKNASKVYKTSDLVISSRSFYISDSAETTGSNTAHAGSTYDTGYDENNDKTVYVSAKTACTYKVMNGTKYVSVSKSGLVTLKKGTPKGTYKIQITAKADNYYKKATKVLKIVVKASNELKNMSLCWDLKNNKSVSYYVPFLTASEKYYYKTGTITLKNYKVTNAKKSGYKQVSFDLTFKTPKNLSKSQIDDMIDIYYMRDSLGNSVYYTIVDYDTGECLENKNTQNVTVKASKWKYSNSQKVFGSSDNWITYQDISVSVTVTYPKDYKNLCIVAGSSDSYYGSYGSNAYFDGDTTFQYAYELYSCKENVGKKNVSKYKKIAHAIRVK